MTSNIQAVKQAIYAGEKAEASLVEADNFLRSAGCWRILDILGGGKFSGFMKHYKVDKAQKILSNAQRDVARFQRELDDLVLPGVDLSVNIGTLWTFADIFSDSIVPDFVVQSKIKKAQKRIIEAINTIDSIIEKLKIVH